MSGEQTMREHLEAIRHACELAGSDHNPMPLQNECLECGFSHPCPTSELATQVKQDVVAAIRQADYLAERLHVIQWVDKNAAASRIAGVSLATLGVSEADAP